MEIAQRLKQALAHRYQVEELVGEGGMALVFRARDLKHHRPVAIKVLRPEISAALGAERFLREIEIAAGLNHPNILSVHDSGEADGLLYFVMPFVEGESLRHRIKRQGRLPLEDVLRIASEIGDALDYAHAHGLVHRDIKPENILFQAGHALVSDFGVAKATTDPGQPLTRTGFAVGTFTYMSPEQLLGEEEVDQRSDVYALGCLVAEMLTGEAPFTAPTPQASLTRKLTDETPDLETRRPDVPPTVRQALGMALASDAGQRYGTAGAFVTALETANTTAAVEAHARQRRRRSNLKTAAGVAGVVLLALATWWVSTVTGGPAMARIAVLPLTSEPPDSSQEYMVAGMHQDLILELAKAGMRVINASSMARFRNADQPIREIARELGVDGVIQGSATYVGDSVGIELALVDPETEELVWAESFGSRIRDVMRLYGRMTLSIADRTGNPVPQEVRDRLTAAPEVDPQVFDALLQARFHWQKLTAEGFDTALDYFRLALSRDSTSVEAWHGIALVWAARAQEGLVSPEEANLHADSAIARAKALDPQFTQNPSMLAITRTWFDWDWDGALEAFQRALDKDPTDSATRGYYAILLLYLGREEEATEQLEQAAEMDPFNTLVQGLYAQGMNALHRYGDAEAHLLRVGEREPNAPMVYTTLRTTYHLMGRDEDAMEMWRRSFEADDDQEALDALDRGYSEGGYSKALQSVAELMVARSDTMYIRPIVIGTLYTRAGMKEEALHYLQLAFEERSPGIPYLSIDPIFDFMRDDPRFQAMVDSLGLPGLST